MSQTWWYCTITITVHSNLVLYYNSVIQLCVQNTITSSCQLDLDWYTWQITVVQCYSYCCNVCRIQCHISTILQYVVKCRIYTLKSTRLFLTFSLVFSSLISPENVKHKIRTYDVHKYIASVNCICSSSSCYAS